MQAMQKSDNQTVPDKAADAWITTKVKSEFATTKGVDATDISVDHQGWHRHAQRHGRQRGREA